MIFNLDLFLYVAFALVSSVQAVVVSRSPYAITNKTLVLYDDNLEEQSFSSQYSSFLKLIESNGFEAVVKQADSSADITLFDRFGNRLYDNVLVFPAKARSLSKSINQGILEQFAKKGGNFLFVSSNKGTQTDSSLFLNQLGIYPSPKKYKFIDYHNANTEQSLVDSIQKPIFLNDVIVPIDVEVDQLAYKDGSVSILNNNEFLIPLLKASDSSVTYDIDRGYISSESTWHSGSQGFLMAGSQALNNARTLWIGSESILSNSDINEQLVDSLLKWVFQIDGIIKAEFFNHTKVDREGNELNVTRNDKSLAENGPDYKVKDFCKFEIGISQWNGHQWVPYNSSDVQLEFSMLDPYYRLTLDFQEVREAAVYGTIFQIPDQHGMFTFRVDYKRPGLSFIDESTVVPVRHLANDEYPRSWEITNSWVYVTSFFAVVAAWLLFVFFYILSANKPVESQEKKNN
ncbi:hypothetical protein FOA43_002827 [Brettanomyces nanus]|uniref:Dolichyl-diphosphooligosaccharide--protein glycosyltransferase subunit WBP1 n=1 Tax=Eeniella nana TaxID=13502 RepID=A0A875S642_EENNA|nr:uncharacterized protein FOA43_002827 [Brettanomyces nanus]QPG75472.1 hypothetical protein FOA43_002827 [Brettanomyces nanus]